jgi:ATP-dependent exoDNAse (exonuclease V) beta subunit
VLASVDFDAKKAGIAASAALHARLLGATDGETTAAVATVERALAHPLLRRASAAAARGALRRETGVALALGDGRLVEGVIDAAFLESEPEPCWTIVDFKTDLSLGARADEYRRQVALYARAIERATGQPAQAVLLQI